jgi:phage tail-like protein
MAVGRTISGGSFSVLLDDERVDDVTSIAGGGYAADVFRTLGDGGLPEKKSVGDTRATPITLYSTLPLRAGAFARWVTASTAGKAETKKALNVTYTTATGAKALRSLQVEGARVTRISLPTLDAASKESALSEVQLTADRVQWKHGTAAPPAKAPLGKQKRWLPSNFRLDIDTLPCTRVSKIEGLSWSVKSVVDPIGRDPQDPNDLGELSIGDITLTISMADLNPWLDKANSWFLDGLSTAADELSATIIMLAADLKTELGRLELSNVGLQAFDVNQRTGTRGADAVQTFSVTLYAERMELSFPEPIG